MVFVPSSMSSRFVFVFFLLLAFPSVSAACGTPVANPAETGTFTAIAKLRNTAEACISLQKFTGQTLAIEVSAPDSVSGRIPGAQLSSFETNFVTIQPGGGKLIVTGSLSSLSNYRIAFRVVEEQQLTDAVTARWVFRGGQGFSHPQAVLTDGISEILRLSCVGGENGPDTFGAINPLSIDGAFDPQMKLGNGGALPWISATQKGADDRWYGYHRGVEASIITAEERAFFASSQLQFGDTAVENTGAEAAYLRLKAACTSGIASGNHPALSCLPLGGGYKRWACLDPQLGALDRQIAEMYGVLTRLAPLADVQRHWQVYADMEDTLKACDRDQECFLGPLQEGHKIFSERLSDDILAALEEENQPRQITTQAPDDTLLAELILHGISREDAQQAMVVHRHPSYTLLLKIGRSSAEVIVVHQPSEGTNPLDVTIDPMDVGLSRAIARTIAPVYVARREITSKGGWWPRTLGGGLLSAYHIMAGSRVNAPVPEGSGLRSLARVNYKVGGWILDSGELGTNTAVDVSAATVTAGHIVARERAAAEAAERQRREREQRLAREREEATAFETAAAQTAAQGGYIYKSAQFWQRFQNPQMMRSVFDGTAPAPDRLILGWAVAFDDHCQSFLPTDVAVFEDTTVTEWRNGYGIVSGRSVQVSRLTVDRRLSVAVERARQSPAPANLALNALDLGTGGPVNWQSVMAAADDIAQPYRDSLRMIQAGGCDGPIAQQFSTNLLASVGQGAWVQQVPILSAADSQAASDSPAISFQ